MSEPVPPGVPDSGGAALRLLGSRVAVMYLCGVVVAAVLTPPAGRLGAWSGAVGVLALAAAGIWVVLARPAGWWPAVAVFAVAVPAAMLTLLGLHPGLSGSDAQELMGCVASAAAAGVALSWGPSAGWAATGWAMACWAFTVWVGQVPLDRIPFVGALAGGLLGVIASWLVRRGYAVTQRALAAADDAVTARAVAAARWRARQQEIRTLHDTVLSTLSLLAQGGEGVDEGDLRADCRAQARLLRESAVGAGPVGAEASDRSVRRAGAVTVADPFELIRRRWVGRSLQVRVYGEAGALRLEGVPAPAAAALLGAVEECLENVRRHAGVATASVVVVRAPTHVRCMVTDEGCGFDGWDTSVHRIGLGDSVLGRIREAGGTVRLWSAPGSGTSVALSVPAVIGVPGGELG